MSAAATALALAWAGAGLVWLAVCAYWAYTLGGAPLGAWMRRRRQVAHEAPLGRHPGRLGCTPTERGTAIATLRRECAATAR